MYDEAQKSALNFIMAFQRCYPGNLAEHRMFCFFFGRNPRDNFSHMQKSDFSGI